MRTGIIVQDKKPYITQKYLRKIRLLLTNMCNRKCSFCHNEGMSKENHLIIDCDKIRNFYPSFKQLTNRIVLTGGEPLLHPKLDKILFDLNEFGFDVTVDTAVLHLQKFYYLLHLVNDIHISFLDYEKISDFIKEIEELHNHVPSLKISINIPLSDENKLYDKIPYFFPLCNNQGVRLQLIKIFDNSQRNIDDWNQRWDKIIRLFGYENLRIINVTERETSFITTNNELIDFIDIPCQLAGKEFSKSSCLNEMDITIGPDLSVQFCRWSPNTKLHLSKPENFFENIYSAYEMSMKNCMCGGANSDLFNQGLKKEAIGKHFIWPPMSNDYLWKINQQICCSSTSYFGKEGYIRSFENEFAIFIGTSFALSCCSGTTAFYVACKALGLIEGSKVILPVYSYPGLITVLIQLKIQIILCDTEPDTGNISFDAFRKIATTDVSAVVLTHLWGKPVNIPEFQGICKKNGIYIIEDGSHAFGATIKNRKIGSYGDVAFFSLQSNKVVYAGEGGIITTNNRDIYEKAVMYSMLKKRILDCVINRGYLKDDESGWGLKLKLNPLGAIMAQFSLRKVSEVNTLRKNNFVHLSEMLSGNSLFDISASGGDFERTFYTFKIILKKEYICYRDLFIDKLIRKGLDVSISSFRPLHVLNITKEYASIKNLSEKYPNADIYESRVISFPSFTYEDEKIVDYYGRVLLEQANILLREVIL